MLSIVLSTWEGDQTGWSRQGSSSISCACYQARWRSYVTGKETSANASSEMLAQRRSRRTYLIEAGEEERPAAGGEQRNQH